MSLLLQEISGNAGTVAAKERAQCIKDCASVGEPAAWSSSDPERCCTSSNAGSGLDMRCAPACFGGLPFLAGPAGLDFPLQKFSASWKVLKTLPLGACLHQWVRLTKDTLLPGVVSSA